MQAAIGRICLQIDDDILSSPQLVAEHVKAHSGDAPRVAIGRLIQEPPSSSDWFVKAFTTAWNRRFDELGERAADWRDCFGANFSAPRELLAKAGGFTTDRPGVADMELGYRLTQMGCVPTYLPNATAVHDDEKGRERLLSDIAGFAGFATAFVERHPETRGQLFGWYGDAGPKEAVMRAALLTLRVSPTFLAHAGGLIPGAGRKQVWYDFVARFAFWIAVRGNLDRAGWRRTTGGLPVLMYHAFAVDDEDRFVQPARSFERQMKLLAAMRYRVISLQELAQILRRGEALPERSVVITIDDGYRDSFEIARPVIRGHGFPATVFPVSTGLGASNDWDEDGPTKDRPLLSVEQIREMCGDGFEVGAHTRTHLSLADVNAKIAAEEIGGSRKDLETALGSPVATFAFPFGEISDTAVSAVEQAGFVGACTTETRHVRPGDNPLLIPRLEIKGSDGLRPLPTQAMVRRRLIQSDGGS